MLIASLWHNIAPYQGNNLPLPGTKRYVVSFFIKAPLFFLLFTLHQIGWNPDKHWGCERWRVTHYSSPLFTPLHFRIAHGIESEDCPVRLGAETTFFMSHRFHRFSVSGSAWRVVKSGVNSSHVQVLKLQVFMIFRWRVKSVFESGLLFRVSSSMFQY